MESLGYMMLYLYRGSLPWQGLRAATQKQRYDRIKEKKMDTSIENLCRGIPNEFVIYLNYTRSLRFDDKPDYSYLRKIFRDLFVRQGFQYDCVFDWMVGKYRKNHQALTQPGGVQACHNGEEKLVRGCAHPSGDVNITQQHATKQVSITGSRRKYLDRNETSRNSWLTNFVSINGQF